MSPKTVVEKLPLFNNVLLISGTGRNVGKTTLACRLIEHFRKHNIIGVKISPHFHPYDEKQEQLIFKSEEIIILEEQSAGRPKDSSRMLRAGAKRVFFIMAKDEHLQKAFSTINELLKEKHPMIIESAALRNYMRPAVFVLMDSEETAKDSLQKNTHLRSWADFVFTDIRQAGKHLSTHLKIDRDAAFIVSSF
jgi:molybdopterin-guanine dinucleotide biosynthesis protein